jgi:hypothetical protein
MIEQNNPFKAVSENLPFWPDKSQTEHAPFVGVLVDESIILGDNEDQTKNVPVYVFARHDTGEKFFIVQSYAIKKAIEKVRNLKLDLNEVVFSFVFKGKTEAKGKPFNQFDTAYCTLKEYELFVSGQTTEKKKGK